MGEEVGAFIVKSADVSTEELISLCRDRLAPYKIPKKFFFVDDMPKNSGGKILKQSLVKLIEEGSVE